LVHRGILVLPQRLELDAATCSLELLDDEGDPPRGITGFGGGDQAVTLGHGVDHAQRVGALGGDRVAGQDHLQRHGLRQRARQAVQAASRCDQAALDLRQAEAGLSARRRRPRT
jgi:hypothetical protein